GWIKGFKEGRGWNGCLTLPRILTLSPEGLLLQAPAPELQKLRGQPYNLAGDEVRNATNLVENLKGETLEIAAELEGPNARRFGLKLRWSEDATRGLTIAVEGNQLEIDGLKAPLPAQDRKLALQLFLDRSVLEVYANGRVCCTRVIYPEQKDQRLALFASG